jgi:phage baseplate assembly protein W
MATPGSMPRRAPLEIRPPVGWPLLPVPDENGALRWPTLAQSVAQHLRKLLATQPGELLTHPDYGAGLQGFLHEPNTLATRSRIREAVERAVNRHEPRVVLEAVTVSDASDEALDVGALRIELVYRLKRDGQRAGLGVRLEIGA